MMWNPRENINGQKNGGEKCIAVAIDKDKTSQHALKWALDHIVTRGETLKLVHVKERTPSFPSPVQGDKDDPPVHQRIDSNTMELLLPFRCFCRRRQIECETIVLEDVDVAKALIAYVCQQGVDTLFLGSTSRNGLSRLFRTTDIPSNVLKWAPDFCTVYVVSKGRISTVRTATRPVPTLQISGGLPLAQRTSTADPMHNTLYKRLYDEMPAADFDNPLTSSGRISTDSNFLNFYEYLGGSCELTCRESTRNSYTEATFSESPLHLIASFPEYNNDSDNILVTILCSFDVYEEEMRRLKTELKQTIEMYHAACKEVLALKQKASELEEWRRKEESKRLQEAHIIQQNALEMAERENTKEKTKCNVAAIGTAEAVQKLVQIEVQKRMNAEMKALREAEKHQVLDALSHSNIVLKYQSLYHMMVVLFLFYLYFSILK
ncbi:U-box domain-containing protein 51 [Ricinus communis]|uniref:U-box domain-containing protein 51 n=1 Tax=Ricinus communis TaxID=3988 RepID=UPI00201AD85C|nr:U-box domain-containing protein 51 [Ricinus communis]